MHTSDPSDSSKGLYDLNQLYDLNNPYNPLKTVIPDYYNYYNAWSIFYATKKDLEDFKNEVKEFMKEFYKFRESLKSPTEEENKRRKIQELADSLGIKISFD